MAFHTKYPLRCSGVPEVLDLLLATPTLVAGRAEDLAPREIGEIFNFVFTGRTAVSTVVAYEGTVSQ